MPKEGVSLIPGIFNCCFRVVIILMLIIANLCTAFFIPAGHCGNPLQQVGGRLHSYAHFTDGDIGA